MLQKLVGTKKAGAIGPRGLQTRTVPLRSVKPGQSMQFLRNALLAQKGKTLSSVDAFVETKQQTQPLGHPPLLRQSRKVLLHLGIIV